MQIIKIKMIKRLYLRLIKTEKILYQSKDYRRYHLKSTAM